MAEEPEPSIQVIEVGDWPGGTITLVDCLYPESIDGGADIILGMWCADHGRSVYYCLNTSTLWCDGGPPEYAWHRLEPVGIPR